MPVLFIYTHILTHTPPHMLSVLPKKKYLRQPYYIEYRRDSIRVSKFILVNVTSKAHHVSYMEFRCTF